MNHTTAFVTLDSTGQRAAHGVSTSPPRAGLVRCTVSSLAISVAMVAWLFAAAAHAQGYANPAYGLTLTPPAGWTVDEQIGQAQNLFLTLRAPTDDAGIVIDAAHLDAADLTDGGVAHRNEVEREAFAGIGDHFPGAEVTFDFFTEVGGEEAVGFDFETPDMYGTVLFVVHGGVLYRMIVFGMPDAIAAADDAFDGMLASIAFTGSGSALGSGTGGANPLVTGQPDPWLGTFAGDQLTMTLRGGGGSYTGQIVFNGQTFPLRAQGGPGQISGTFDSGSGAFSFTAVATGTQVTFATGGATYELRR
jgi:hypothetical protein